MLRFIKHGFAGTNLTTNNKASDKHVTRTSDLQLKTTMDNNKVPGALLCTIKRW